jgi:fructosamine-3-kinase
VVDATTQTRLERLLGAGLTGARNVGGGHGVTHYRLTTADGRAAFAKLASFPSADSEGNGGLGGFAAEAAGLRWLAEAGAVPVPAVLAWDSGCLVTEWVEAGGSAAEGASRFGRELAALHLFGAERFGAAWPGTIAGLPLPNGAGDRWPEWYGANRLLPYLRIARDAAALGAADVRLVESAAARSAALAGPDEPPSRIHGDCWSGNVLWSGGRGWLIDPAAHGGHRETDLAMLALFGAPYLDQIMAGYCEVAPLADGWRSRVPLHQLHPLLVHVCLFGASYRESALTAARAVLAA